MTVKKPKTIKEFTVVHTDETGKETKKSYLLIQPNNKVIRDSRWQYSIMFNRALKDGLLTERQMAQILNSDPEKSRQDSETLTQLYIEAGETEFELNEETDSTKRQEIADRLRTFRADIFEEEVYQRAPYSNTAEQRAEELRTDFLLMNMVCNNDKECSKIWEDKESFETESDLDLMDTARNELMYWVNNLDSDWEKNLPENKVLDEMFEDLNTSETDVETSKVQEEVETTATPTETPAKKTRTKTKKKLKKTKDRQQAATPA